MEALTRQGIDGEIDWERGFAERARRLAGLRRATILRKARDLRPVPGAVAFVQLLKALGYRVVIVTGGPREIAESATALFDADACYSNEFMYEDGVFTGAVLVKVNPQRKGEIVRQLAAKWRVRRDDIIAFGDGRMDLPLLAEAGLRVGINSRGRLRRHVDLDASDYVEAMAWLRSRHGPAGSPSLEVLD